MQKIAELRGVLYLQRAGCGKRPGESRGEDAGSAGYAGGILMRWPWRLRRAIEPRRAFSSKAMEILAEVFGTRPGEVKEMIQRRLVEGGPEDAGRRGMSESGGDRHQLPPITL